MRRLWAETGTRQRLQVADFCLSSMLRVLIKSNAFDWSAAMQMRVKSMQLSNVEAPTSILAKRFFTLGEKRTFASIAYLFILLHQSRCPSEDSEFAAHWRTF